ncbi:uncharacterized protein LOC133742687 [Rosa rugosa]|nr:uncharacterized protein LOC112176647 [Rosa chinensis]XP_062026346.1 uncharacterized protein LOC133742687 [Rosa rugosa]
MAQPNLTGSENAFRLIFLLRKPPPLFTATHLSQLLNNSRFTDSQSKFLIRFGRSTRNMALTNFILTVAGVSAVVLLLRSDVKQSATIFRRNVKHIRKWLEEESKAVPKELETKVPPKDVPKEDKH